MNQENGNKKAYENTCPYCKGTNIIRHGQYNGKQRYRCKHENCRRTFLLEDKNVFKFSKKFKYMWKDYFNLIIEGATIRECAAKLKISIVTSFMWRHRILDSFKIENDIDLLREYVELTKIIVKENFKGSRNITTTHRGRVNIVSGIDSNINIFSIPLTKSYIQLKHLDKKVFPRIDKKAYVIGFLDRRFDISAKKHNELGKNDKSTYKKIDSFLSIKAKRWMKNFYGVATKFIDYYLEWYIYLYKDNEGKYDKSTFKIKTYIKWDDIRRKTIQLER